MALAAFKFKPFTNDLTPHAQMQEWADYYQVKLNWGDKKIQTQGITKWTSYLIIRGVPYQGFVGVGGERRNARAAAAEHIISCSKTLGAAKAQQKFCA